MGSSQPQLGPWAWLVALFLLLTASSVQGQAVCALAPLGDNLALVDLPNEPHTNVSSVQACCDLCASTPGCGAFAYTICAKYCWLNKSCGWTLVHSGDTQSGILISGGGVCGTPPAPVPPITPTAAQCGSPVSYSGNQGTFNYSVPIGDAGSSFNFSFDAYSIPDRFVILAPSGQVLLDTGYVSGSNTTVLPRPAGVTTVLVQVFATNDNTEWEMTVGCANSTTPALPSSATTIPTTTTAAHCGSPVSYSGNQGTFNYSVPIGDAGSSFSFSYEAFSIPDRFVILAPSGQVLLDTGYVSGSNTTSLARPAGVTTVLVRVFATNADTEWNMTVGCAR